MQRGAVVLPSGEAQSPFRRRRSMEMQLPMRVAAVSSSRVAQWPSHRAPSVGTQLIAIEVAVAVVSSSMVAQWPSHRAPSVGTQQWLAVVSSSRVAQWPSHRAPSVGTQLKTTAEWRTATAVVYTSYINSMMGRSHLSQSSTLRSTPTHGAVSGSILAQSR